MKRISIILFAGVFSSTVVHSKSIALTQSIVSDTIPALLKGNFVDDYDIKYRITNTVFTQLPNTNYHIISWDTTAQFLLARNDDHNPGEGGLYTRIDYMRFNNMPPFEWGYCLTAYNAKTLEEAKTKATADRSNPKKGCGGYPFSRMKKIKQ